MQRYAVIDVGSNTIHLLVAECDTRQVQAVHDLRVRTPLGAAVALRGAWGVARIHEVAEIVARFAKRARRERAQSLILVATESVRAAADRAAIIAALEAGAGVPLHLLSAASEAILCLAGAGLESLPPPPFLLADIGGGSCDLAAVGPRGVLDARSLQIGSGVLAARCLAGDPPEPAWVRAADAAVEAMLDTVTFNGISALPDLIVTGGAVRRLRRQAGGPGHLSATADLLPLLDVLLSMPAGAWPHPLKDPDRAATTRAGAVILRALLRHWEIQTWRASSYGLREGALLYHAQGRPLDQPRPTHAAGLRIGA